jgi:hypothetical protein
MENKETVDDPGVYTSPDEPTNDVGQKQPKAT